MQIISPQQIPGLLQNDIMHTLYANPHTHKNDLVIQKDSGTEARQHFSFYHNC